MLVEPSSLIFLVIIGIWAAYFVQYWVRRREHLATIRSVDAFSETMRVLELRAPLPSVDGGGQSPRTYAVSPARAMRPQVTVKRAEAHSVAAPSVAPRRDDSFAPRPEPEVATMSPSRSTRGLVLLVGLLGTVVFGLLAAFGVLVPWSPVVPLLMAGAGFAWLRAGVRGETRARREAQARTRRAAARGGSRAGTTPAPAVEHEVAAPEVEQQSASAHQQDVVAEAPAEVPFDVAAELTTQVTAEPAAAGSSDGVLVEEPFAEPAATHEIGLLEVDDDDIPITWDPRPVPRPTYTMKARAADRPAPAAEVEPAAVDEHTAYDDLPQRRIVGG